MIYIGIVLPIGFRSACIEFFVCVTVYAAGGCLNFLNGRCRYGSQIFFVRRVLFSRLGVTRLIFLGYVAITTIIRIRLSHKIVYRRYVAAITILKHRHRQTKRADDLRYDLLLAVGE